MKCLLPALFAAAAALFAQVTTPPSQQTQPFNPQRDRTRMPGEQQPQANPPQGPSTVRGVPEEKTVVTHHSARIGGQPINYTATTGTYVIKADDDTPKATFFY